jgi:hypothetical protein
MIEAFYQDISVPGQKVVATIDDYKVITHYVLGTTEEIIPFLSQFEELNTYHSVGGYQGLPTGKQFEKKGSLKNLTGCVGASSFVFDLDVGDKDGQYDSLEEAFDDISAAVEQGNLPEPRWILYSGGGLQIYYVVDEILDEVIWTPRFQQLKRHVARFLKVDPTVGSKPYRLVRSPCTANWKYEEPVMPQIITEVPGDYLSLDWLDQVAPQGVKPKASKVAIDPTESELKVDSPISAKRIIKACKFFQNLYQHRGSNATYPVWFSSLNVAAHTKEFRTFAHILSKGHSGYSREETDLRFDEVIQNASAGPHGCHHFGDTDNPDSPCHGCWAAKAGLKNPVSAARHFNPIAHNNTTLRDMLGKSSKKKPAPVLVNLDEPEIETSVPLVSLDDIAVDDDDETLGLKKKVEYEYFLPDGWEVVEGIIQDSEQNPVCQDLCIGSKQRSLTRNDACIPISADYGENWTTIPAGAVGSIGAVVTNLANAGIYIINTKKTHFLLMQAMSQKLHYQITSYGFSEDLKRIVIPKHQLGHMPDNVCLSPRMRPLEAKWGGQRGTMKKWLKAVQIYERPGQEPYLMALLASLASPLLKYHDLEKGVLLSLIGAGGAGKTTSMLAATSVWGKPLGTLAVANSTYNAIRHTMTQCGNLPFILDDVSQTKSQILKNLALDISQGENKARLDRNSERMDDENWQLICLTTSNVSVLKRLAEEVDQGVADMDRVFEVPVTLSTSVSIEEGRMTATLLKQNFGHIGPKWMEALMDADMEEERKSFKAFSDGFWREHGLEGRNRFYASLITSCYWAHRRIKEMYPDFPGDPLMTLRWMSGKIYTNASYVSDVLNSRVPSIDDFVTEFSIEGCVLSPTISPKGDQTARTYIGMGQNMKGYIFEYGQYYAIPTQTFDKWCTRNALKTNTVLDYWQGSGRVVNHDKKDGHFRARVRLQKGLIIDGVRQKPTVILVYRGDTIESESSPKGATAGSQHQKETSNPYASVEDY